MEKIIKKWKNVYSEIKWFFRNDSSTGIISRWENFPEKKSDKNLLIKLILFLPFVVGFMVFIIVYSYFFKRVYEFMETFTYKN